MSSAARAILTITGPDHLKIAECASDLLEFVDTHDSYPRFLDVQLTGKQLPEREALIRRSLGELRSMFRVPAGQSIEDTERRVERVLRSLLEDSVS